MTKCLYRMNNHKVRYYNIYPEAHQNVELIAKNPKLHKEYNSQAH